MAWKFIHCVFSDKAQKVFIVDAVAFRNSLCIVATELYKAASQPLLYFIAHSSPFGFLFLGWFRPVKATNKDMQPENFP